MPLLSPPDVVFAAADYATPDDIDIFRHFAATLRYYTIFAMLCRHVISCYVVAFRLAFDAVYAWSLFTRLLRQHAMPLKACHLL